MFRYPGGKLRLMKKIDEIIISSYPKLLFKNTKILDCFVGGGGSLINMAKDIPKAVFYINDLNFEIYSFWRFFNFANQNDINDFTLKIKDTTPTLDLYFKIFSSKPTNDFDMAFKIIFLNKTSYNGVVIQCSPIGGKNQTGKWKVGCYWNKKRISNNILNAYTLLKNRIISVSNLDYKDILIDNINQYDLIYADPPYIKHGKDWYGIDYDINNFQNMMDLLSKSNNYVAISIDNDKEILNTVYPDFNVNTIDVIYSAKSSKIKKIEKNNELVFIKK